MSASEKLKMSGRLGRPCDPQKDRAILDAARALLFGQGPKALTMEAVAEHAQVSKATLYSRYANRLALIEAVVTRDAVDIHRALQRTPTSLPELGDALAQFVEELIAFMCGAHHKRLMQALAELPQGRRDLGQVFRNGPQRTLEVLASYLDVADNCGLLHCTSPMEDAELLLGMAMGLDLVRSQYRVPLVRQTPAARGAHACRVVSDFIRLHEGR